MLKVSTLRLFLQCSGLVALATLSAACTYTSDYVPPQDGRARVLFEGDEAVASLPPAESECLTAVAEAPTSPRYVVRRRRGAGVTVVYWAPVIRTQVSHPRTHVVTSSVVTRRSATPVVRSSSGGSRVTSSGGRSSGGGKTSASSGKSGGSGGSGGDAKALAIAAVVVLLALPIVMLVVAASSPESGPEAAAAIDQVNAYNDLARTAGSPCAPEMIIEEVAPSPDAPAPEAPAPEVAP